MLHWSTGIVLSLMSDGGSSSRSDCRSWVNGLFGWEIFIGFVVTWCSVRFVVGFAFLLNILIILLRIKFGWNFCLFFMLNSRSLSSNSELSSSSSMNSSSSLNDLSDRSERFSEKRRSKIFRREKFVENSNRNRAVCLMKQISLDEFRVQPFQSESCSIKRRSKRNRLNVSVGLQ